MASLEKARNQALINNAVRTYREGVEGWFKERAAMLGFGIGISLTALDDFGKIATRTTNEESRERLRRACVQQKVNHMCWIGQPVIDAWEKIWGNDGGPGRTGLTDGCTYVPWEELRALQSHQRGRTDHRA